MKYGAKPLGGQDQTSGPFRRDSQKPLSVSEFSFPARFADRGISRHQFITEVAEYIHKNQGPDSRGYAHPLTRAVRCSMLEKAIEMAEKMGLQRGFRPYHFAGHNQTFSDSAYRDEVIVKKGNQLLQDCFNGDIHRLCTETTTAHISGPLIEHVADREISVSMKAVQKHLGNNVLVFLKRYLGLTPAYLQYGEALKPYYLAKPSQGTYSDQETVNDLIRKKFYFLLKEKFGGSFARLVKQTTLADLLSPIEDSFIGRTVSVRTSGLCSQFNDSPSQMTRRFCEIEECYRKFHDGLRPYHFGQASPRTFKDEKIIDEILAKKCESLLRDRFGNDPHRLFTECSSSDILSAFEDPIGDTTIPVSMGAVGSHFNNSTFQILRRFSELRADLQHYAVELSPYHLAWASRGTFSSQEVLDEVLKKKFDQLLSDTFGGNPRRLIAEVTLNDIKSPLTDTLVGKAVLVSMASVTQSFDSSPYKMLSHYFKISVPYRQFAAEVKPYHLAKSQHQTSADREMLLVKKCKQLIAETFSGDVHRFCTEVTSEQIKSPFIDSLVGVPTLVSMHTTMGLFEDNVFEAVKRFCELDPALARYAAELRPYHMAHASNGTYSNPILVDELVLKKGRELLSTKYGGNPINLLGLSQEDLLTPFVDTVAGNPTVVSTAAMAHAVGDTLYGFVKRFYQLEAGLGEYAQALQPYHLERAMRGFLADPGVCDALLIRKVGHVLSDQYHGDIFRLCTEARGEGIAAPLIDTIAGNQVKVSMHSLLARFPDQVYSVIHRFLELNPQYRDVAEAYKPYHSKKCPQGYFHDQKKVDDLIRKKVDFLLKTKFHGSMEELCAGVTASDLAAPFADRFCSKTVIVRMGAVANLMRNSPYEFLKRYHSLVRKPFPFSRICFLGPPEARLRRLRGELNPYDLALVKTLEGGIETSRFGLRNYSGQDKSSIRDLIVHFAAETLGDQSIKYVGLESEQFASIRALARHLNLDPKHSMVVERDPRVYRAMQSTRNAFARDEGPLLKQITIEHDDLNSAIRHSEDRFNLFNLDFLGQISPAYEAILTTIFEAEKLEKNTVIVGTLDNSPIARSRAGRQGYHGDQSDELKRIVDRLCGERYKVVQCHAFDYRGGTTSNGVDSARHMLAFFFHVIRAG